jgi:hypothetical protein
VNPYPNSWLHCPGRVITPGAFYDGCKAYAAAHQNATGFCADALAWLKEGLSVKHLMKIAGALGFFLTSDHESTI